MTCRIKKSRMRNTGLLLSVCLVMFMASVGVWKFSSAPSSHSPSQLHLRHLLEETGNAYEYRLLTSSEISAVMREWATKYPDFARVTTSQEKYGLPRAGGSSDCPHDEGGPGCLHYILTIQDYTVHSVEPVESDSSKRLPTVLWSGELHGDERVGPTATIEGASLLLRAAACEAKPDMTLRDTALWETELQQARDCRVELESFGVSEPYRQWLARLVATRRIVVVPTANSLGYARGVRTEDGIDPNRDFPFDKEDSSTCMRSIAGRTLNEIFREEIVQCSLTYHGGIEMIAYEWGATSFQGFTSPDDEAQRQLASAFSSYGGSWSESRAYIYGPANDIVYPIRGGMEDWAYAGSFAGPEFVQPCQPSTYDPYPMERTMYEDSTLRAFNMLIETSDEKRPVVESLGSSIDVVRKDSLEEYNGHVARNVRVALLATDLVEPYLSIVGVNGQPLADDLVPVQARNTRESCQNAKKVVVPVGTQQVVVQWTVGGAITIDDTSLQYGRWEEVAGDVATCMSQPSGTVSLTRADNQNTNTGTGYYSGGGATPSSQEDEVLGPVFEARVDLAQYLPGDQIVVMARARVDSSWLDQPSVQNKPIAPSGFPPQSHMVNARNNPNWSKSNNNGKVVQGRLDWYTTIPLTIVFGQPADGVLEDASDRFAPPVNAPSPDCLNYRAPCSEGIQCCSGVCLPMTSGWKCSSDHVVKIFDANRLRGNGGSGGGGGGAGGGGGGGGGGN